MIAMLPVLGTARLSTRRLKRAAQAVLIAALAAAGTSCGTNPVTGEQELQLISRDQEIRIGEEQYLFARQSQGGTYRVEPSVNDYVQTVGQRLVKVSDRPDLPYEFVVLNNSTPNAWALPGGKIAVNRGLLVELASEAELAAVLGHEIVHAAARHGAKNVERGILLQVGVVALGAAVADSRNSEHTDLVVGAAALGANLLSQKYSRDAEREADRYGMQYMARAGYDPQAAVALQQTFVRLSENKEPSWLEGLFASHPPSPERVEANRKMAAQLPEGGRFEKETYAQRVAHLTRTRSAYERYQQGRKALADGDLDQAYGLAGAALEIEPREALFHALQGDVRFKQRRYDAALRHYNAALERDNRFFYYYRQRGLTHQELAHWTDARRDLQRSVELLPTARAHYALGDLARRANQRAAAIEHYRLAANDQSEVGRQAQAQLVRLDLAQHPQRYLDLAVGRVGARVGVRVRNPGPVAVGDILVEVVVVDERGRVRGREQVAFSAALGPGTQRTRTTSLAASDAAGKVYQAKAQILRARVVE